MNPTSTPTGCASASATKDGAQIAPTSPPTWRSLLLEVAMGQATILLEQPSAPGDRYQHPLARIVVCRLDGTIWEARYTSSDVNYDEDRAVQWDPQEAERILGLERQQVTRLQRLRGENGLSRTLPGSLPAPNWPGLMVEVANGTGRLRIGEPTDTHPGHPCARIVVQRADGSVWEARVDDPRHLPAVRWTDWEVQALDRVDRDHQRLCERLEREVSGALARARAKGDQS